MQPRSPAESTQPEVKQVNQSGFMLSGWKVSNIKTTHIEGDLATTFVVNMHKHTGENRTCRVGLEFLKQHAQQKLIDFILARIEEAHSRTSAFRITDKSLSSDGSQLYRSSVEASLMSISNPLRSSHSSSEASRENSLNRFERSFIVPIKEEPESEKKQKGLPSEKSLYQKKTPEIPEIKREKKVKSLIVQGQSMKDPINLESCSLSKGTVSDAQTLMENISAGEIFGKITNNLLISINITMWSTDSRDPVLPRK